MAFAVQEEFEWPCCSIVYPWSQVIKLNDSIGKQNRDASEIFGVLKPPYSSEW